MSVDRRNAYIHRLFGRSRFAFAEALRQWRFSPGEYQGQPVTTRARTALRFSLQ